jgi:hypothetical protein
LNELTKEHKTLWKNTNLAKNIDYFKMKVKIQKVLTFSISRLGKTSFFFAKEKKTKNLPRYIL